MISSLHGDFQLEGILVFAQVIFLFKVVPYVSIVEGVPPTR